MQDEGSLDSSNLKAFQSAYRGWLSMMMSSEGPPFQSCLGPPTLNPLLLLGPGYNVPLVPPSRRPCMQWMTAFEPNVGNVKCIGTI